MQNRKIMRIWEKNFHETEIAQTFDGAVYYDGTGPVFDTPLAVLLFSNRSGSNLLAEHLINSGSFCGLGEVLNYDFVNSVKQKHGTPSFPKYLESIARDNARDGEIFGVKASIEQLAMLLRWKIPEMFSGIKIINIERHDLVEQAVSMSIAMQTKSWSSEIATDVEPVFDFEQIAQYFENFACNLADRRAFLDLLKVPSRTLNYHAVVSEPSLVVNECCRLFGVTPRRSLPSETMLKKQGTERNAHFAAQFRKVVLEQGMTL
ncbi:Stf0 family sulfotransferase [Rhodovulum sulfidophilum]|uniref:Stf0 family sulfotransferase n=1 Tax=Rhodovulum sulfidophilum TaxID=35806 RepID=UPI0019251335|nr:Stf0 family sulfotransferase [Rhodovulum sulfidophilum]MBL3576174.1 hypothetical protein [Rhodovulum sulfidophilum]MCE8433821.1 Stf0 family sulfotransferase [Rhodovulum sulfidophilum]MCF4119156.1 Stf0 family sulfotransferase [Rhodovulum sulfidophilum]